MKTLTTLFAILAIALPFASAQGPATPPTRPEPVLELPAASVAKQAPVQVADQIVSQINSTVYRVSEMLEKGQPERKDAKGNVFSPAVSAADIAAALGTENVAKIKAAVAALRK